MSRREGRDSDSKHHRSRFDQEPSPKRSRRDVKLVTERPPRNRNLDGDHSERDQKHRRRLQDALPLEAPLIPDPKFETGAVTKESDNTTDGHHEGTKNSSDPIVVPRSRSYFQDLVDHFRVYIWLTLWRLKSESYDHHSEVDDSEHNKRGNAGQVGRSFSRRAASERGWWTDSKDQQSERVISRVTTNDKQQRDEKLQPRRDDSHAWRHDGYLEMEADPKPSWRKRSFTEKKIPVDSENADKAAAAAEPVKPSRPDRPVLGSERREERGGPNSRHHSDRSEKPFSGDREANRGEAQRGNFSSRDRYAGANGGGGSNYRGRERFTATRGYRPSGVRVEKWKHDLFDEANRSPTPKNEEDQIAKVEALLAS